MGKGQGILIKGVVHYSTQLSLKSENIRLLIKNCLFKVWYYLSNINIHLPIFLEVFCFQSLKNSAECY